MGIIYQIKYGQESMSISLIYNQQYKSLVNKNIMAQDEQMGVLVLLLGDFHIPHRAAEVPLKYRQMITPNKINTVICTGNMGCRQIHDWAKSLSNNFHIVKGDFQDESIKDIPQQKVVQVAGLKIGVIHGHQIIPWGDEQALGNKAIQLGVDTLVSGHSHQLKFTTHNGINFINPGSMTGAFSTLVVEPVPSFVILQIKHSQVTVYQYSLVGDQLKCVDSKFEKKSH